MLWSFPMHSAVSLALMQRWPSINPAGFLGQTVLSNDPFALDKWRIQVTHCFAGCVIRQYVHSVWCQVVLYRGPWHETSTFRYKFPRRRIAVRWLLYRLQRNVQNAVLTPIPVVEVPPFFILPSQALQLSHLTFHR